MGSAGKTPKNPYEHWTSDDLKSGLVVCIRQLESAERMVIKRKKEVAIFIAEIARRAKPDV
jgi:hypothetical protein